MTHHHEPDPGETPNAVLYMCRDKNYDISKLSPNNRSKVRRGLKRMEVRKATPDEIAEHGYACSHDTHTRNGLAPLTREEFQAKWRNDAAEPLREIWAAFVGEDIAAVGVVLLCGAWAELFFTQSSNEYLKDYSNYALFYTVINDLIRRDGIESVSYGLSSVQPDSKVDSLHHFKLSVNLEAIPVVRRIQVNPLFRVAFNPATVAAARLVERMFPTTRHVLAARGALELMVNGYGSLVKHDPDRSVRPFEHRDASAIAALHRRLFPEYRSTSLGPRFCARMYRRYATTDGAFGFVIWRGGERAGFVVGGGPGVHARINRSLRGAAAAALAMRPALAWKSVTGSLSLRVSKGRRMSSSHSVPHPRHQRAAKLVLIGVKENARGTGAAAELLDAFREEAARRGFDTVCLVVNRNNARARASYAKAGWACQDNGGQSVEYHRATAP